MGVLTKDAAKDKVALMPVYRMWAEAVWCDVVAWVARVIPKLHPADLPSRAQELPFETEPQVEIASLDELYFCCDMRRLLQRAE